MCWCVVSAWFGQPCSCFQVLVAVLCYLGRLPSSYCLGSVLPLAVDVLLVFLLPAAGWLAVWCFLRSSCCFLHCCPCLFSAASFGCSFLVFRRALLLSPCCFLPLLPLLCGLPAVVLLVVFLRRSAVFSWSSFVALVVVVSWFCAVSFCGGFVLLVFEFFHGFRLVLLFVFVISF